MTVHQRVTATKNPQEALLVLAAALDEIHERLDSIGAELREREPSAGAWGEWDAGSPAAVEERAALVESVYSEEGGTLTEFAATTDEAKIAKRKQFADDVLSQQFGRADLESGEWHPDTTIMEAFVNAGPLWLYAYDREFVMQLPMEMKIALIEDVHEDDPEEGRAMGRDLLKDPSAGNVNPERWANAAATD